MRRDESYIKFSLTHRACGSSRRLSEHAVLTYLWSVSDGHGADDQCVSGHGILGQLGVCWVVRVCGLRCQA